MYLCKIKVHSSGSFAAQPSTTLSSIHGLPKYPAPCCPVLRYIAILGPCQLQNKTLMFYSQCMYSVLFLHRLQVIASQNYPSTKYSKFQNRNVNDQKEEDLCVHLLYWQRYSESVYYDYLTCFVCWGAFIGTTLKSKWGKFHTLFFQHLGWIPRVLTSD